MMCPAVAVSGNPGQSKLQSCVDGIVLPSGIVTCIGVFVGLTFRTFTDKTIKCPVVPESSMP